jgi:hypothetical protein
MIRKSMPLGHAPMGGTRFFEKIMLKQREEIMIRFNLSDHDLALRSRRFGNRPADFCRDS